MGGWAAGALRNLEKWRTSEQHNQCTHCTILYDCRPRMILPWWLIGIVAEEPTRLIAKTLPAHIDLMGVVAPVELRVP